MNTFASTYKALQESIETNYVIESVVDFDLFDASFLFDTLGLLKINPGKTLGIYRKQDEIVTRSFIATPYVHDSDANQIYYPVITPKKKTFAQWLGVSSKPYKEGDFNISESYSTKYLLQGVVDYRVTKNLHGGSGLYINPFISLPQNEEAVWQMFLLDNIKYFLPKFDHGAYMDRKLIFSHDDIKDLPASIQQQFLLKSGNMIIPNIKIDTIEEHASVQCIYFNRWEGIVKWTCHYSLFGGNAKGLMIMLNVDHMETQEVLAKYDCGIRF